LLQFNSSTILLAFFFMDGTFSLSLSPAPPPPLEMGEQQQQQQDQQQEQQQAHAAVLKTIMGKKCRASDDVDDDDGARE